MSSSHRRLGRPCKRFELNFCKVILFSYAGKITMTLTVDPEFKGDVFVECPPDILLRTPFFGNGDFWIEISTLLYAIRILKSGDEQVSNDAKVRTSRRA